MKLLFSLSIGLIILIAGCRQGYELSKTTLVYGYDFTKYSSQGFLFTPESYNGDYEAIGLIELAVYPEVRKKESASTEKKFDTWENVEEYREGRWFIEKVSASEVLDSLYNYTKQMGANAVVRLEIGETESKSNGEINLRVLKPPVLQ